MANSEGSEAMLNRVMTKDNIGVAVLLELRKELIEMSCKSHFVNVFNRWYFVNKKKNYFCHGKREKLGSAGEFGFADCMFRQSYFKRGFWEKDIAYMLKWFFVFPTCIF